MAKTKINRNWILIITFIFSCLLCGFISYKLFYIQLDTNIALTHSPRVQTIEAQRGNILSEDGRILSVTMPVYDIRLDLHTIDDKLFNKEVVNLCEKLSSVFQDKSASEYEKELRRNKTKRYFLFKRDISYIQLQEIKTFPIFKLGKNRGGFIPEMRSTRDYPFGSLGKVTVGRVEVKSDSIIPINGIEKAFNEYLQGIPGKEMTQEISGRVLIPQESDQNILPVAGKDVVSTINIEFQDAAESSLRKKLLQTKALWGTVVLMEVQTGNIKAIANLHRSKDSSSYTDSKNHAIITPIAPGSTFKLASLISVLEDGYIDITDSIETGNGKHVFFKETKDHPSYSIRDTKKGGYGKITLGDVFVKSSNIGISRVIFEYYNKQPDKFIKNLNKLELTNPLTLQLPYADRMLIKTPDRSDWWGSTLPAMSIGYEMKLSPLHILTFYNAFANKGRMVSPQLVKHIKSSNGIVKSFPTQVISEQICSKETINKIMPYMIEVVRSGTAQEIYTEEYLIAGKTGTCKVRFWEWNKLTKFERSYTASFVGFFPADNPKYSCIVVIHDFIDPTDKNHYGGTVAGPVFKEISDKVFAFDSEMEYFSRKEHNSMREKKIIDLVSVQTKLDISIRNLEEMKSKLDEQIVPDLTGMAIMDILSLLENSGLNVEFSGVGRVVSQSLNKDERFKRNSLIKLNLF